MPSGLATPDSLHLRKMQPDGSSTPLSTTGSAASTEQHLFQARGVGNGIGQVVRETMAASTTAVPPCAAQVLEQQDAKVAGATFGSAHTYAVPKGAAKGSQHAGADCPMRSHPTLM